MKIPSLCQVLTAWEVEADEEFMVGVYDNYTLAQEGRTKHQANEPEIDYMYGIEPWVIEGRYE